MKLLLDENIANKIKERLIELGLEDIKHINEIKKGLTDQEVFELAKKNVLCKRCQYNFKKIRKNRYKRRII